MKRGVEQPAETGLAVPGGTGEEETPSRGDRHPDGADDLLREYHRRYSRCDILRLEEGKALCCLIRQYLFGDSYGLRVYARDCPFLGQEYLLVEFQNTLIGRAQMFKGGHRLFDFPC